MGGEHSAFDSDNVHIKGALHEFTCWLMVNKLGLLSPMLAQTLSLPPPPPTPPAVERTQGAGRPGSGRRGCVVSS